MGVARTDRRLAGALGRERRYWPFPRPAAGGGTPLNTMVLHYRLHNFRNEGATANEALATVGGYDEFSFTKASGGRISLRAFITTPKANIQSAGQLITRVRQWSSTDNCWAGLYAFDDALNESSDTTFPTGADISATWIGILRNGAYNFDDRASATTYNLYTLDWGSSTHDYITLLFSLDTYSGGSEADGQMGIVELTLKNDSGTVIGHWSAADATLTAVVSGTTDDYGHLD